MRIKYFLIICLLGIYIAKPAEVQVLEDTPRRLKVKIFNNNNLKVKQHTKPVPKTVINLAGANTKNVSDSLNIPRVSRRVALPNQVKPQVSILNSDYKTVTLNQSLTKGEIENIKEISNVEITKPGFSRFIPYSFLNVYPIQPLEDSKNKVKLLQAITLIISFQGETPSNKNYNPKNQVGFINKVYKKYKPSNSLKKITSSQEYPAGKWFRVKLSRRDIYEIKWEQLEQELEGNSIKINKIALYSNQTAGRKLNNNLNAKVPEKTLVQNNIKIKSSDNQFNQGDKIVFYGRKTSGFDMANSGQYDEYNKNFYSDTTKYWLVIANEALNQNRMPKKSSLSGQAEYTQKTTISRRRFEKDRVNIQKSGNVWYERKLEVDDSKIVAFKLNHINTERNETLKKERSIKIDVRDKGISPQYSINNEKIGRLSSQNIEPYINKNSYNYFSIQNKGNHEGYYNYLELSYYKNLVYEGDSLFITGDEFTGAIKYSIDNAVSNTDFNIFDITDPTQVKIQEYDQSQGQISFVASNNSIKRSKYYISSKTQYSSPDGIEYISDPGWNSLKNQSNRADYIIITDQKFTDAAQKIANIHQNKVPEDEQLRTKVVFQSQIMREFNGGIQDPVAIRYFLKYAFNNWAGEHLAAPKYVLLLGDGSYDHRQIKTQSPNYVMTYQVYEGGMHWDSESNGFKNYNYYPSDIYFTFIRGDDKDSDLAIGRIPVSTKSSANKVASKIEQYLTDPIYGEWRNHITLVADDPWRPNPSETVHINDTEYELANNIPSYFNKSKLYALEYPAEENASSYGIARPKATQAILQNLGQGTSLITYLGHSGPTQWSQEGMLEMHDLNSINTGEKLPIWLSGSCSWNYFDNPQLRCMPEKLILAEGRAIATFGAAREVFASSNADLLREVINNLFTRSDQKIRLGELIRKSLNNNSARNNDEKYNLLGDPALFPAIPSQRISLNSPKKDTLKALSTNNISGKVKDKSVYNGNGIVKVFDSEKKVHRVDTHGDTLSYTLPGETIFKGRVEIKNSKFHTKFTIPKDISFRNSHGYINFYGWNPEDKSREEVVGLKNNIYYSGTKSITDTSGPEIEIGVSNIDDFKNNDLITKKNAAGNSNKFEILLEDKTGINITNRLGHSLSLQFDNDKEYKYNVTENFEALSDTSGKITYSIPENLNSGDHTLEVIAWDNANNVNMEEKEFTLTTSNSLELKKVVNYPNPFNEETNFTFQLTRPAEIEIKIYTIRGLLIKKITRPVQSIGFNKIHWRGKDDYSDRISRGIYLYKIEANSPSSSSKDSYIGKVLKE